MHLQAIGLAGGSTMLSNNPVEYIYLIIIGMAAVTYFSRELPFVILKGKKLKPAIVEWMGYIPIAVLAALLIPALLIDSESNKLFISFDNLFLITGILTFLFGLFIKNLFAVIIFGVSLLAILRWFI